MALTSTQQSAFDLMNQTLQAWGLGALAKELRGFVQQGMSSDQLNLALRNTPEYKTRFAGNEARKAQGLPELTPAQYIATEEQYRNTLAQYGLPQGFYDSHDDFNTFIANDLSPAELDSRAKIAAQQWQNAAPEYKQAWKQYYGLSDGSAIAAILNPATPLETLQNLSQSVAIGATAAQNKLNLGQSRALQFAQSGVTLQQAQAAYQKIAAGLGSQNAIANRFGSPQSLGQTQAQFEDAELLGLGPASEEIRRMQGQEEALFKGAQGADQNSVAASTSY